MRALAKKIPSPIRQGDPKPNAMPHTFAAPIRGLVLNENIAASGPAAAQVLDNWVCTSTGIRVRGGSQKYATLPGPVLSMFAYRAGASRLFAATATTIYDITTNSDPDTAASVITGQTGGDYSWAMFGTAGGDYLVLVNGQDSAQLFNGTTWQDITASSAPSITGVDTSDLSHVWSFANRLFFVERGTLTAHYLPVDSVGGAAEQVSLAGTFKLGGSLLFGANWSVDAGDGMDDKCVFVSTQGEVAVFVGTNPAEFTNWRCEGIYQIARPLGRNAIMKAGGELIIATEAGMVPLSVAVSKDPAALAAAAVSSAIEPLWRQSVAVYDQPWSIAKWNERGVMLIATPSNADDGNLLCCSLDTGGWSRWTNIGARCLDVWNGYVFAGGNNGTIKRLETGGTDMGVPYTAVYIGAHEDMGAPGMQKTVHQARALFRASHALDPKIVVQVDYLIDATTPPNAVAIQPVGVWDAAVWDESVWDAPSAQTALNSYWRGIGRTGYAIAPELQMTFGMLSPPKVELVSISMTYSPGALVA